MNENEPIKNFTIYLIKKDKESLAAIIQQDKVEDEIEISGSQIIGTLYIKKANYKKPKWARTFDGYIDTRKIGNGGNPSALLLIEEGNRCFAITFGQGRFLLQQDCWEERFGLKAALNIIKDNSIKSLDKKTFDAILLNTREQASKGIGTDQFGLDIEKDLLSAVVGIAQDKTFGERVSGMDSFKTAIRGNLEDLKDLCNRILDKSEDGSYKEKYPWVDHLTEIKDKETTNVLDDELVKLIQNRSFEKCWASVPEIINWNIIEGFKYGFGARSPIHYDIHLFEFLEERLKDKDITIESIKNKNVYMMGQDDSPIGSWPIYKCLYCEIITNNKNYILNNGKWYQIDEDFIENLNAFYNSIPRCTLSFPEYDHDSEGEYNEFVGSQMNNFALMDRKLIDNIEFCDLFDKNGYLIHVKRYGASSVLSHLFMQGVNSGELFQTEANFRVKVNLKLPHTHKIQNINIRPMRNEYEVVYAIISDSEGENLELPFFSKLTLRTAFKRLDGFGYRVSLKKILVTKNKKMLKKYPPGKKVKN